MKRKEQFKTVLLCGMLFFLFENSFAQDMQKEGSNSVVYTANDSNLQWGPCPDFMPEGCEIAVLHGDPARENVDIFFKVPPNSQIPKHAHTSAERMILVSGELEVTYEGEQPQTLREGSYAYGPAKKPHTARCGNNGPCVLYIAFEEPLDAFIVQD